jgi:hypoxanthine phosphoribosyltransferase
MADIDSSSQMEIKSYPETWESFGSNMDKFIDRKRNELANDNYDLILGFTRGGYIVALVLSTLLRDKIKEVYDMKKNPIKRLSDPFPPG